MRICVGQVGCGEKSFRDFLFSLFSLFFLFSVVDTECDRANF